MNTVRIDLMKACSIPCEGGCGRVLSRGDSVMVGDGKMTCLNCYESKNGE